MGKGTIISEYGAGKYLVSINYDRERLDALLASIDAQIAILSADIAELTLAEDVARAALSTAGTDLDIAIIFYTSDPSKTNKLAVKTATTRKNSAIDALDDALAATATAELRKAALEKRDTGLRNAIPDSDPEVDAWCADLNEGLVGEVGLIEPGRIVGDKTPIINPAGTDGDLAAYDRAKDGSMLSPAVMSPEASFYNHAILAGANKWKPRYRKGVITAKDGDDKCTVSFAAYPITSTSQDLDVNQSNSVEARIEYMNCNGLVFAVDDHVIVAFMNNDWADPVVIGFVRDPKACDYHGFMLAADGTDYNIVDEAGGWVAREAHVAVHGAIDWRGPDDVVLSWDGASRYFYNNSLGFRLCRNGKVIKLISGGYIMGAAMSGNKLFYVVGTNEGAGIAKEEFYFADLDNLDEPRLTTTREWDISGIGGIAAGKINSCPWLISEDGTGGTTVRNDVTGFQRRYHIDVDYAAENVSVSDLGEATEFTDGYKRWHTSSPNVYGIDSGVPETGTLDRTAGYHKLQQYVYRLEDYLGDELIYGELDDRKATDYAVNASWGYTDYNWSQVPGTVNHEGVETNTHTIKITANGIVLDTIELLNIKQTGTITNSASYKFWVDTTANYSRIAWLKHLDIRSKSLIYETRKQTTTTISPWLMLTGTVKLNDKYDLDHGTCDFSWESVVIANAIRREKSGHLSSGHRHLWWRDHSAMISPPLQDWDSYVHACETVITYDFTLALQYYGYHGSGPIYGELEASEEYWSTNPYSGSWYGPKYRYEYPYGEHRDEFKWQLEFGFSALYLAEGACAAWYPGDTAKVLVSTEDGFYARSPSTGCLTPGLGDLLTWSGAGEPYTALITDGNIDDLVADSPRFNIGVA